MNDKLIIILYWMPNTTVVILRVLVWSQSNGEIKCVKSIFGLVILNNVICICQLFDIPEFDLAMIPFDHFVAEEAL